MDTAHVLEAVKNARGSHVIEAFLCSGAPGKQKRRLVAKYVFSTLFFVFFFGLI